MSLRGPIRGFAALLVKLIAPGAWGAVVMAHMPIVLAISMHDRIRSRIPFGKLAGAVAASDAETGTNGMFGDLSEADIQAMARTFSAGMPPGFAMPGGET